MFTILLKDNTPSLPTYLLTYLLTGPCTVRSLRSQVPVQTSPCAVRSMGRKVQMQRWQSFAKPIVRGIANMTAIKKINIKKSQMT